MRLNAHTERLTRDGPRPMHALFFWSRVRLNGHTHRRGAAEAGKDSRELEESVSTRTTRIIHLLPLPRARHRHHGSPCGSHAVVTCHTTRVGTHGLARVLVLARNYMQHIKRQCRSQSLVRLNAQTERGHCKGDRRATAGGYEELRRNILGRPLGASFGAFATQSDRPTIHHVA